MRRRLLAHYLAVLLDAFAVDRQVEVFLPVRYGAPVEAAVEQKTNVDLKTLYFGGAVPSLCTCLLNGSVEALSDGALSEAQLTEALGQFDMPAGFPAGSWENELYLDVVDAKRVGETVQAEA